jgi:site-specific recombinase XerD
MKQQQKTINIDEAGKEFERRLTVLRYSESIVKRYLSVFRRVKKHLEGYGESDYSRDAGCRFLAEYLLHPQRQPGMYRSTKTVIHRLDEICEGRVFAARFSERRPECPECFKAVRDDYIQHAKDRGLAEGTVKNHNRHVNRLLTKLFERGVERLNKLDAANAYKVVEEYEPKQVSLPIIKTFFYYLYQKGMTVTDYSPCVPRPPRPQGLPSIYTAEEISLLFSSIDRSKSVGKRDYAVLMLASHLGMRSSDIANLALGNIDRNGRRICFTQVKTGRPTTLVLNSDVQEALDDYIENGRPASETDKIFIGIMAPFAPIRPASCYAIAEHRLKEAGIEPAGRKRGPHALRMSYATALVARGIPYAIVTKALGHDDPQSAKYYVRLDIERLRMCALDVPRPTGTFAINLGDLEGSLL